MNLFPSSRITYHALRITFFVILSFSLRLSANELKIELPPETASFKTAPGVELANGQCLSCHSMEYVLTQPPFPRTFWAAEVKKMREKFGASIPDDQIEPLTDYLANNYGSDPKPVSMPLTETKAGAPATVEVLATRYGCLSCHNITRKVVGPPFQEVAAKYRSDPAGLDKILHQIHNGGTGKPGAVIMPPFPFVSETEAKRLALWILSQQTQRTASP